MSQFLIIAEDFNDADALARRLSARELHLERMRTEKLAGNFIVGGAKLDTRGNMHGSLLIVALPDETAVHEWIKKDPYMTGKVWDKITVFPFKVADV